MADNGQIKEAHVGHKSKILHATLLLVGIAMFSSPAHAQDQLSGQYDGPYISYQQIYDNPEDYRLNFNYALQEAEAGNLGNAASALERLLFVQPNWHSARLLYAAVLFRLDDVQGAQRELRQLDGQPLTAGEEQLLRQYRSAFTAERKADKQSSSGLSGRVEAGFGYDNNAANAFADNTFFLSKQGDSSAIIRARLDGDFTMGEGVWSAIGGLAGLMRRYQDVSLIDHDAVTGYGGLKYSGASYKISARYDLGQMRIDGNKYLKYTGPAISYHHDLTDKTVFVSEISLRDEDYEDFRVGTFDSQRSGDRLSAQGGLTHKVSEDTQIRGLILYTDKDADNLLYAYDGWGVRLDGRHRFEGNYYVRGLVQFRDLDYSVGSRSEKRSYAEIVYGVPLENLGAVLGQNWEDSAQNWAIEFAVDYVNRDFRNFGVTRFQNTGGEIRLAWDF